MISKLLRAEELCISHLGPKLRTAFFARVCAFFTRVLRGAFFIILFFRRGSKTYG